MGSATTPRITLPLPVRPPVAAEVRHRVGIVCSLAGGAVLVVALVTSMGVLRYLTILLLVAGVALLLAGVLVSVRAQNPLAAAAVSSAVLVPGLLGFGAACAGLTVGKDLPPALVVLTAALLFAVVCATFLLRPRGNGTLARPRSPRYRAATRSFDAVRLTPARATVIASPDQARAALAGAVAAGLPVRMHGTGHKAGTTRAMGGAALLKVRIHEPVTVDPVARTARIPAGTTWGDVVAAITPHKLGAAHGSSGRVGAVGYLLGGGLSAYARTTGIAANSIESIEVLLADGEQVTADRSAHSDLFWAIRGGGGGFGIVTAITVRLFDLTHAMTGTMIWDGAHAADLLNAWHQWARSAPDAITTSFRLMRMPPLPGLPPALTRHPIVAIDGSIPVATAGSAREAEALVAELRSSLRPVAPPRRDTFRLASPLETAFTHMDPPIAVAQVTDSFMITAEDHAAVECFGAFADLDAVGLATLELRHLGAALARPVRDGGAVSSVSGDYFYWGLGLPSRRTPKSHVTRSLDEIRTALAPWQTGFVMPTYAPEPGIPHHLFDSSTRARVDEVRATYDPDGLFSGDVAFGATDRN
ncbi:FAD-binding oxidoreductase [Microbacterium fluvii]|nr:FAD-binding protein [Microbacterium fluvii]MCU4671815.1 FAD-binding protein [Microbacterium fluvii]